MAGRRSEAEPDLGVLAGRLLFSLQKELFERLGELGHGELRPRHGAVFAYLDVEGSRATDLARLSGQHKQVIGTLVDELEALGYVERLPDPADRRAKLVVPTERGIDEMTKADAIVADIEQRHAEAIGQKAYKQFKRSFQRVAELQQGWRETS